MKKITLPLSFVLSFCCFFFFFLFVILGELPFFPTRQKDYRNKLLQLEKHYNDELMRIEKKTYASLSNESFSNWLDGLLRGENYIDLSKEEAKMVPKKLLEKNLFVIKDPFLSNFLVMSQQGRLLYTYDKFDGGLEKLNEIALLDWDGFSVSNNETLNLIFPTSLFHNSKGKKIKDGYIVLLFKLKDICRGLFFKNDSTFDESRLMAYRYGFVYNVTDVSNVEKKVSEIIDRAYKINSKWKFITSSKDKLSFVGYRLPSGVLFAYLYSSTLSDMSWASQWLFLVFFANLTILLGIFLFKKNFRDRFFPYFRRFSEKWGIPPSIPLHVYQKYWRKAVESSRKKVEILSLLKDLDAENKSDRQKIEEIVDKRASLGLKWDQKKAQLIVKAFSKNKALFEDGQERFFKIKNILDKLPKNAKDVKLSTDSFAIIAILELQKKKWVVTEYSGMDITTVNNFFFQADHPLITSFQAKKLAVCIKTGEKGSPLLKNKLSNQDYQKIYGILFVPIILDMKKKRKIEMFVVLG